MEDVTESGDPQTPYLYPQDPAEGNDEVPDFILDDARVGSPMGFSDEEYSDTSPSLSTILAIGATSPCLSPTPSLVSDVSLMSEFSANDSFESDGTFKMKKYVHFLDSVEIVPYAAEEPTLIGPLKPPQRPLSHRTRKSSHNLHHYYTSNEDIGILHGLGRAGSPRSSSLSHMRQREFNSYRPHTPFTDTSDLEEDGHNSFGSYKRRTKKYHHDQFLTVPQFQSPSSWRMDTKSGSPPHDILPRVKSPEQPDITSEYGGYEDSRFILGETSPPFTPPISPPLPHGDGVYRVGSNLRSSPDYIASSLYHPQPQRQNQAVKVYSYWRDGEIRYEDQWGTRIYPREDYSGSGTSGGGGTADSGFTRDMWTTRDDQQGGKLAAIPGGRMTYGEHGLRRRGIRR